MVGRICAVLKAQDPSGNHKPGSKSMTAMIKVIS